MVYEQDLGLFRLIGIAAYRLASGLSFLSDPSDSVNNLGAQHLPRRRRLCTKQLRPPAFMPVDEARVVAQEQLARMRTKYWSRPLPENMEGAMLSCPVAGCQRKFTSKICLSNHIIAAHREGTYREHGFDSRL